MNCTLSSGTEKINSPFTESWEQGKEDESMHPFTFQCEATKVEGNIVFVCHEDQGNSYRAVVIKWSEEPKNAWKVFVPLIIWVAGMLSLNPLAGFMCQSPSIELIYTTARTDAMMHSNAVALSLFYRCSGMQGIQDWYTDVQLLRDVAMT